MPATKCAQCYHTRPTTPGQKIIKVSLMKAKTTMLKCSQMYEKSRNIQAQKAKGGGGVVRGYCIVTE